MDIYHLCFTWIWRIARFGRGSRVAGRGSRVAVRGSAAGLVLSWVEVGRRRETEEEGRVLGGFLSPSHHQSREKKSASTGVSGGVV